MVPSNFFLYSLRLDSSAFTNTENWQIKISYQIGAPRTFVNIVPPVPPCKQTKKHHWISGSNIKLLNTAQYGRSLRDSVQRSLVHLGISFSVPLDKLHVSHPVWPQETTHMYIYRHSDILQVTNGPEFTTIQIQSDLFSMYTISSKQRKNYYSSIDIAPMRTIINLDLH